MHVERPLSITEPLHLVLVDPGGGADPTTRTALGSLDGIGNRALVVLPTTHLDPEVLPGCDVAVVDLSSVRPTPFEHLMQTLKAVPHVPILAIVAAGDPDMASRALVAGATAVVRRPRGPAGYAEALRSAVADLTDIWAPATSRRQARGSERLRRAHPEHFGRLVHRYAREVQARVDRSQDPFDASRARITSSTGLSSIARELAALQAGPRDVADVHMMALRGIRRDTSISAQPRLSAVAKQVLIEVMGQLVSLYRQEVVRDRLSSGGADDEALA